VFETLRKPQLSLAGLLIFAACLCSCVMPGPHLIQDIICPQQVPASFEAMVVCKTNGSSNDLSYKWYCDNGTIKGTGNTVIWVAPGITGRYGVGVIVTDKSGNEEKRTINIDVVSFGKKDIDIGANIDLKFPLSGNNVVSEQFCTYPTNTLEISSSIPGNIYSKYSYTWSSNGGKMMGPGIKDGTADKVGWTAPGVAGNYTVKVIATDGSGNLSIGHVYVQVKAPHCCEIAPCGGAD
jgi:hypothetical protein